MKRLMKNFVVILFASIILTSCGSSIENNSWSGKDTIAGAKFAYALETKPDNTYILLGKSGGMPVKESGTYKKISNTEIKLLSGAFAGSKFVKEGFALKWYLDSGSYFMSLN